MLIFFFVRGVIVTFRPDTLTEAQQVISDFRKELVTEKKLNNEVLSFAQNFVYEYLTYTAGEEKDYKERLKQYITTTSNVSDTEIYKGAQKAVYVQAYRMDQLDKEHFDVYVLAEVQYEYYREQEATQESAETRMKVPVLSRDGEMVVDGLPMFVMIIRFGRLSDSGIQWTGCRRTDCCRSRNGSYQFPEGLLRAG